VCGVAQQEAERARFVVEKVSAIICGNLSCHAIDYLTSLVRACISLLQTIGCPVHVGLIVILFIPKIHTPCYVLHGPIVLANSTTADTLLFVAIHYSVVQTLKGLGENVLYMSFESNCSFKWTNLELGLPAYSCIAE